MKYGVHPSKELMQLFCDKPYQGQNPENAKVLIVGNDANYSPEISNHAFFNKILDYHADGVSFWKETGKHHPFLLDEYPLHRGKGGVTYHRNFSKMMFGAEDAEHFSFVELLNIPTIGNTGSDKDLFFELIDKQHLEWLESLILEGEKKFVIINQTLAKSIRIIHKRFNVMGELTSVLDKAKVPSVVLDTSNVVLYNGYSFSYTVTNDYLNELSTQVRAFLC
jgi:hypothetical protein